MIVEVTGVNFFNKGAQLMMAAIIQEISRVHPNSIVAANITGVGTFQQREQTGLAHLVTRRSRMLPFLQPVIDSTIPLIPLSIRRSKHIVANKEVRAVLNASGFAYGDQFGYLPSELMAEECVNWKKQGKKLVFLPQAFGPFENLRVRRAVSRMLEHVDLVFARDQVSFEYLISLSGDSSHIKIAPDFTNLVTGRVPDYFDTSALRPCVIPNYKMKEKTSHDIQRNYLPFLAKCIQRFFQKGLNPFILLHETNTDKVLAEELRDLVGQPIEIIFEPDPLYLKGIIGYCSILISSRFHGLVSSLSQAVPSLGTGWSHKYRNLFEDYNCPECLISPLASNEEICQKIDMLIEEPSRSTYMHRLQTASQFQKELAVNMWIEVHKVINKQR